MLPFRPGSSVKPCVPPGERIYAIGDVHGEIDLLAGMLRAILDDSATRGACRTTIVLLGDFIDRGPGAAALLRGLRAEAHPRLVILRGNHETAMVAARRGDEDAARFWLAFGGAATLAGFGIPHAVIAAGEPAEVIGAMRERIDDGLIDWLADLPLSWSAGDYFFVHAGIRPGVALAEQEEEDQLWIRDEFLGSRGRHPQVIVHGHTIEPGPVRLRRNRIGLDTGAHEHGVLSALGLEGGRRWTIQARRPDEMRGEAVPAPPVYEDIRRLLATILERPGSGPILPVARGCTISVSPDRRADMPAGSRKAAGIVAGATALGMMVAATGLVASALQREPASIPPSAQIAAVAVPSNAVTRAEPAARAVGAPAREPGPPIAATAGTQGSATPPPNLEVPDRPAEASATGREAPSSDRSEPPRDLSARAQTSGRPVDPYAGRVAAPLAGAAQREAILADRLATRELNLRQIEAARARATAPDADAVTTGHPASRDEGS